MRNGWPVKHLGDLSDLVTKGTTPTSIGHSFVQEGINFVKVESISTTGQFIEEKLAHITPECHAVMGRSQLKDGDILFSIAGALGRTAFVTDDILPANTNQALAIIRLKKDADLLPRFVQKAMETGVVLEQIEQFKGGVAQQNLSLAQVRDFHIALPPFPEQKRIVGILDKAFEGVATAKANAEKNLQNARALFESHLHSSLLSKKWRWKTLGDLCDGVEYGTSAKSKTEGKVPVLRMGNIQDGKLDWESLVYTDDVDEIAKYLLRHNDVLFNRTNSPELVGKTAIYKSEMPAIFAGYLIRINRKEDLLDADFLNYFLNSQIALDYGKTVVISSVNQANINGAKLKSYPIPAPSLSEQRTIVTKLDSLSEETKRLASIYERKFTTLETLKKSLLHQAFTGEL